MTTELHLVGADEDGVANANQMPPGAGSFVASATAPAAIADGDELLVFAAMAPCRITAATVIPAVSSAASDSDYVTVQLLRYPAGIAGQLAQKTTKTLVSGGEAMTAKTSWNFDQVDFANNDLSKGDVITAKFVFTGTPAGAPGPGKVRVQVRYEDVQTPMPVALDSTFGVIGDLHFGNDSDDGTPAADRADRILASLSHPLVPTPAAFVHAGDNTEDGTNVQLDLMKDFLDGLPANVPSVITHGNHDVDLAFKTAAAWATYMGFSGPNRVQDVGDEFRFVIFGSDSDPDVNDGITQIISSSTLSWLNTALTACDTAGRKAILLTHAPLYDTVRATPQNSFDSRSGQWHAVSVDVDTTLSVAADTSSATSLTVPSTAGFPASGWLLVTNAGGTGQQRTLQYTAKTGTTFTVAPNGSAVTMTVGSTVRWDDQSAALKAILGNHACTKLYLCGHTHSPKDAPGLVTTVALTGSAAHTLAHVNASSPFYLSGGGLKKWTDPIITYWPTLLDDRVEVRAFDHGAGVWTDIGGSKVATVSL